MSLLPCDLDPVALRVVDDDGYWDIDALREHVKEGENVLSTPRLFFLYFTYGPMFLKTTMPT